MNQGVGREAIHADLRIDELRALTPLREIATEAQTKEAHLSSPDRGARLAASSLDQLTPEANQVQILISDGLSAEAVRHNAPDLIPANDHTPAEAERKA